LVLEDIFSRYDGTIEDEVTINGRVAVVKGTKIPNGSVIRAPVILGKNCTIGPHALTGPYTAIGDGCRIVSSESMRLKG
jgi:NDP-sugar pyrophosphorylase family protein